MQNIKAWLRRHYRLLVVCICALAGGGIAGLTGGEIQLVDGFFYDIGLSLNPHRHGANTQPVVVVALDRDSLDDPVLADTPRVFFGPQWSKMINGAVDHGAASIGFDFIFNYAPEKFAALADGYDDAFQQTLTDHHDKLVMGRATTATLALPYLAALFDAEHDDGDDLAAVAFVEVNPDADGVVRRVESTLDVGDQHLTTLAARLLDRAGAPKMPRKFLLAPDQPMDATRTVSFADVLNCIDDKSPEADEKLKALFDGKVVLVGTTIPEEDRKETPDRFMRHAQPPGPPSPPPQAVKGPKACKLPQLPTSDPTGGSVPGVYVHAETVQDVIKGSEVSVTPIAVNAATSGLAAAGGAVAGIALAPWLAILSVAAGGLVLLGGATGLITAGLWWPVTMPLTTLVSGLAIAYVVRFLTEERKRRRIQNAFGHYLAPSVVNSLADSSEGLRLGGESREVTVMFADLSGFTALSGLVGPEKLMEVTNKYLGLIAEPVTEDRRLYRQVHRRRRHGLLGRARAEREPRPRRLQGGPPGRALGHGGEARRRGARRCRLCGEDRPQQRPGGGGQCGRRQALQLHRHRRDGEYRGAAGKRAGRL